MFSATITGEKFPLIKHATVHDVICTRESFDFKAFLYNVTFENYQYINENANTSFCSDMNVFKRHPGASDGTASHHLRDTYCTNCDQ